MAAMSTFLRSEKSSKQRGYNPSIYNGTVDNKYRCPQCSYILRNPVQTGCGERFCRPCADSLLREPNPICPLCNETLSQKMVFRDVFAEREVLALPVRCEHYHRGCKWQGHLRDLDEHMETCEHTTYDCPNKGCGKTLPMAEMKRHSRDECAYRVVACDHCSQQVQFRHLEDHLQNVCSHKPLTCIQCKKTGIHKDKMEEHLSRDCPRQPLSCELYSFGCKEQFLREDQEKHDQEFAQKHLSYLMPTIHSLTQRITVAEQQNSEFRRKFAVLEERQAISTGYSSAAHSTAHDVSLVSPTSRKSPLPTTTAAGQDGAVARNTEKIKKTEAATEKNSTDIAAVRQATDANSRALTVQDIQLSDVSLRLDIVDVKTANGVLVWKIGDIARRRREAQTGKTPSLYSAPFYTSPCGYKMCARIYLDGDGMGKGGCISVFFVLMRGEYDALLSWPFQLRVTMMLLDQSDTPLKRNITEVFKPDSRSASFKRPTAEMNTGSGCPMFSSVNVLESPTYVKDDIIFIKVIVDKTSANYTPPDQERA